MFCVAAPEANLYVYLSGGKHEEKWGCRGVLSQIAQARKQDRVQDTEYRNKPEQSGE